MPVSRQASESTYVAPSPMSARILEGECTEIGCGVHSRILDAVHLLRGVIGRWGGVGSGGGERNDRGVVVIRRLPRSVRLRVVVGGGVESSGNFLVELDGVSDPLGQGP